MKKQSKKFWMVQSDQLASVRDSFGRDKVDWPGRSIFATKDEAVKCAKALLKKNPAGGYFVMQAVELIKIAEPIYDIEKLK